MQDRFKFRVWNKKYNKMYDFRSMSNFKDEIVRIEVDNIKENREKEILIFDDYKNSINDCILMQCTGLKDKNGKLIYEGDIVKHNVQGDIVINYGVVFFDKEKLMFLRTTNLKNLEEQNGVAFWYATSLEVIGNIYENPEILEVGNEYNS